MIVFVITRGTWWIGPVDDPVYSAHNILKRRSTNNSTMTLYTPDAPASAFGCQYQVKLPNRIVRRALTIATVSILLLPRFTERQLYRSWGPTHVIGFYKCKRHSTSVVGVTCKNCVHKFGSNWSGSSHTFHPGYWHQCPGTTRPVDT